MVNVGSFIFPGQIEDTSVRKAFVELYQTFDATYARVLQVG